MSWIEWNKHSENKDNNKEITNSSKEDISEISKNQIKVKAKIEKIQRNHIDDITKMYIELKKENFSLNSSIFNNKRIKLKNFWDIKKIILEKYNNNYYWYVLLEDNKAIGYIFWYDYFDEMNNDIYENVSYKIGVIDNLYLFNDYRNSGYWKKLMDKIINDFNKNECEIIELTTNINSSGEKFYRKLWFKDAALILCKNI